MPLIERKVLRFQRIDNRVNHDFAEAFFNRIMHAFHFKAFIASIVEVHVYLQTKLFKI